MLPPALVKKFRLVACDRLVRIQEAVTLLVEGGGDEAVVQEMMREIHTVKGESRMMGFAEQSEVSHIVETMLICANERTFLASGALIAQLERGLDAMSTSFADGEPFPFVVSEFVAESEGLIETTRAALLKEEPAELSAPETPLKRGPVASARGFAGAGADAFVRIDLATLDQLTANAGELASYQARREHHQNELEQLTNRWHRLLQGMVHELSAAMRRSLHSARFGAGSSRSWMGGGSGGLRGSGSSLGGSSGGGWGSFSSSAYGSGSGHWQQAAAGLNEAWTTLLKTSLQLKDRLQGLTAQSADEDFENSLRLGELRERIRTLRLTPLSTLFAHYPSAVEVLAEDLGKRVRVDVREVDIDLDKQVINQIADPLLHLVRNAVDHGVEPPDVRESAGKPATATLTLSAVHKGPRVEIEVRDDGRGIDVARVRDVALQRGLIEEKHELSDEEILNLLFEPGFSTREQATQVSGRGVGLDVVKQRVERLGGTVALESVLGEGTRFRLGVPVSVAMVRVFVFEALETLYGIASHLVTRVLTLNEEAIEHVGSHRMIVVDGVRVALHDLAQVLGGAPTPRQASGELSVLLIGEEGRWAGYQVERFLGERQVVNHAIDDFLSGMSFLQGSSVMESGELMLMLHVPELGHLASLTSHRESEKIAVKQRHHLLLVDDSEMTRELMARTLRESGFRVSQAVNGHDALNRLRLMKPSLLITDIDMPILNGFELLKTLRSKAEFSSLPIIVMSSRMMEMDRQKALSLGADAYLIKSQFESAKIVGAIMALINKD